MVKVGIMVESYERQDWDCSFENDEGFGCMVVLNDITEIRKHAGKGKHPLPYAIHGPDPSILPFGFCSNDGGFRNFRRPKIHVYCFNTLGHIARKVSEKRNL